MPFVYHSSQIRTECPRFFVLSIINCNLVASNKQKNQNINIEKKFCQNCGMPLSDNVIGTKAMPPPRKREGSEGKTLAENQ